MNRRVLAVGLALVAPLIVVLLIGLGRDPRVVRSPLVGRQAPPFALLPVGGGTPVNLAELRGKPVVVNFWATWCVPCLEEHGTLRDAARAWQGRAHFLGVIYQDDPQAIAAFLARYGSAYPSLVDEGGKTAIAFGVYGVPETFFIGPDGTVVEKFMGPLDAGSLEANLRKASEPTP